MILPTKHIPVDQTLLGIGAILLEQLQSSSTVSTLWGRVRDFPDVGSYERFVLALTFLYTLGLLEFREGHVTRVDP